MKRIVLKNISPAEYEHSLDRDTLDALRKVKYLDKVMEFATSPNSSITRFRHFGSNVRVTERQFSSLHRIMQESCEILDIPEPLFYVDSSPRINAYTSSPDQPIIGIHGYLLDMLTEAELRFVIGHEIAHIKSKHNVYHQLGDIISGNLIYPLLAAIPLVGPALAFPAEIAIRYAYFEWSRAAEYTCDRGGLLCCQDVDAACTALMKLAGYSHKYADELSVDEFIEQGRGFQELGETGLGLAQKAILSYGLTHPWTVSRVSELLKFTESGEYQRLLHKDRKKPLAVRRSESSPGSFICSSCKKELSDGVLFCSGCGYKICPNCGQAYPRTEERCKACEG